MNKTIHKKSDDIAIFDGLWGYIDSGIETVCGIEALDLVQKYKKNKLRYTNDDKKVTCRKCKARGSL